MNIDIHDIDHIIATEGKGKQHVIPILQAIQTKYNYLPEKALRRVCDFTQITPDQIISVASFYSQFRLKPVGDHLIKVCTGTACHVKNASLVFDAFQRELKLGPDEITDVHGKYTLEKVSCLGCCTLAPVVQFDNLTYGHVSTGQVEGLFIDFEKNKNAQAHKDLLLNKNGADGEIRIGLGSCCSASGSTDIKEEVERLVVKNKLDIQLKHVGCVGLCHQVPLVEIVPTNKASKLYAKVQIGDVQDIIGKHFKPSGLFNKIKTGLFNAVSTIQDDSGWEGIDRYSINVRDNHVSSFLGSQIPIATEHRGSINPLDIEEYIHKGGFKALEKCLIGMTGVEVIEAIKNSGLRGRGGAGFPSGIKWELVAKQKGPIKYLICNGDEGDPGAFMDRMLLESYPYRVIEGMLIAAYATGTTEGFFYIRAEYPLAVERAKKAIDKCIEKGFLGENILGSDFSFDLKIYQGAGAFVCGEETALINSIEGDRGFPSIRPPYPAEEGLWGKPTLVNNTETYAQVAYIINKGWERFSLIGTETSKGTKVFALAGKIQRGGLIEVPMGITIRQVVEDIGGGAAEGRTFKAVQIGGPSGGCIPASLGDTPIDYESLKEAGAMMGSGGLVVMDDTDCMVDIARYFLSFTQEESCGKCTFCRIGTKRMLEILDRICTGRGKKGDIDKLEELSNWTTMGSLCGLGKTAPNPVNTTLKYFREEYEAHINGRCPTGKCKEMISYSVNDNCIGCTKCVQKCPVDAIPFTPYQKHTIDMETCIKCDNCREVCPYDAIDIR